MLTNAQALLIKAEIQADGTLNSQPNNGVGDAFIAEALNLLASPNFPVWRTDVPVQDVFNAIDWAVYTPTDPVTDAQLANALAAERATTRLMVIQTKQMNLQNMLMGRITIDASKANIRAGLRDAVIQVPAGAAGANVNPGGTSGNNVLNACVRPATRAEKVLVAQTNISTGGVTANILGFEGEITVQDVNQARNAT